MRWFGMYHIFKVDYVINDTKPKKDHSLPSTEGRVIRWHSQKYHTIWNRMPQNSCLSSARQSPTQKWGCNTNWCTCAMDQDLTPGGIHACHGYAPKGCCGANSNGWASIGVNSNHTGNWIENKQHNTKQNKWKKAQLWKIEKSPVVGPWHNRLSTMPEMVNPATLM